MGSARVLLCDDSAEVRVLLRTMLDLEPDLEVVAEASNGVEGMVMSARLQPDVLVLDLAMPYVDGVAVLERMDRVAPNTNVVVLSAVSHHDAAYRAATRLATAFVEKGRDLGDIVEAVRKAAASGTMTMPHGEWLSDDDFRRFFSSTDVGVSLIDHDGRLLRTNDPLDRLLGDEHYEIVGERLAARTHPDDAAKQDRLLTELFSGQRDHHVMHGRYVRADGTVFRGRLSVSALPSGRRPEIALAILEELR